MGPQGPLELVRQIEGSASAFKALVKHVERVISPRISDYADQLEQIDSARREEIGRGETGAKVVMDNLWGFINVEPQEILVLDSPPLQRLRRIKQLAPVELVFHNAGYSRFEHSLGALEQAQAIMDSLSLRCDSNSKELIARWRKAIRLAAIVHDVGHLPFSHVTERYYSRTECSHPKLLEEFDKVRSELATFSTSAPKLAECLSIAVIRTEAFRRLLRLSMYSDVEAAACVLMILGIPWSAREAFAAQIVSHNIDADKLDYMFRDSLVTGVPIGLDRPRLLLKLELLHVEEANAPASLRAISRVNDFVNMVGLAPGGEGLQDEVAKAREDLFRKIYQHQKTRAAESLILRILDKVAVPPVKLLAEDDSFFSPSSSFMDKVNVHKLALDLADRQLPKRAVALPIQVVSTRAEWTYATERHAIERAIEHGAETLGGLRKGVFDGRVFIEAPPRPFGLERSNALYVRKSDGSLDRDDYKPWALPSRHAYVFFSGSYDEANLVFCATELELFERGIITGPLNKESAQNAKRDLDGAINETKLGIEQRNPDIYHLARLLRPRSAYARGTQAEDLIKELSIKFASYQPGQLVDLSPEGIRGYLDQFPEPLVPAMLNALNGLLFLSDAQLGVRFEEWLRKDTSGSVVFVPLTKGYKSGARLAYAFSGQTRIVPLERLEKAVKDYKTIVFFDDVIISGPKLEPSSRRGIDDHRIWMKTSQTLSLLRSAGAFRLVTSISNSATDIGEVKIG
jgi:HD superfamily phosphohydrolase